METLTQYLEMGGHGSFIWPSYGVVFVVLLGLWILSRRYAQSSSEELAGLTVERPHRDRGPADET